jgi:hypothetical protein
LTVTWLTNCSTRRQACSCGWWTAGRRRSAELWSAAEQANACFVGQFTVDGIKCCDSLAGGMQCEQQLAMLLTTKASPPDICCPFLQGLRLAGSSSSRHRMQHPSTNHHQHQQQQQQA